MNVKRYALAAIALFVCIFIYEGIIHGYLLRDSYLETKDVWRDFAAMEANTPKHIVFQLLFAAWTAFIFTQFYPESGLKNGLLFGLYLGVFAGFLTSTWYLFLPVPALLGLGWFVFSVLEGIGSGIVLGLLYRK